VSLFSAMLLCGQSEIFFVFLYNFLMCIIFSSFFFPLGVVDVPYLVLEPTHNKQDFADGKV